MIKFSFVIPALALVTTFPASAGNNISDETQANIQFIINNSTHNKEETYLNTQDISDTALCASGGMVLQAVASGKRADAGMVDNLLGAIGLRSEMHQMLISQDECTQAINLGIKQLSAVDPEAKKKAAANLSVLQNKEKALEQIKHKPHRASFSEHYAKQS